jgi:putative endonuclease
VLSKKRKFYKFGKLAEFFAIFYLKLLFYKILEKNYRNKLGEIDIIAVKNKTLIAVEVKARKKINSLEEIVSKNQMNRIKRSMNIFYSRKKFYDKYNIRFDLIIIQSYKLPKHYKNFWN